MLRPKIRMTAPSKIASEEDRGDPSGAAQRLPTTSSGRAKAWRLLPTSTVRKATHSSRTVTAHLIASFAAPRPIVPLCTRRRFNERDILRTSSIETADMRQAGPRLLMLGLDAVSLPFVVENRRSLPNLTALLDGGMLRELRSSALHLSASVWPTFSTGRQPGEHGQYFPFQWSAEHRQYLRVADPRWSDEFDCQPFWYRVAAGGASNHRLRHRPRAARRACAVLADHQLVLSELAALPRRRTATCSRTFSDDSAAGRSVPKCRWRKRRGNAWRSAISWSAQSERRLTRHST